MDALGISLGFMLAICVLGTVRELAGTGAIQIKNILSGSTISTLRVFPEQFAINIFVDKEKPAGAFLMFGLLIAAVTFIKNKIENKKAAKASLQQIA